MREKNHSLTHGTKLLPKIYDKQRLQASIRYHMDKHRVSIKDLHAGTGVATATIQRIRSGTTNPRMEALEAIAKFFNISMTTLLRGIETEETDLISEQISKVPLIKWDEAVLPEESRKHSAQYILVDLPISASGFALQLEESFNLLFTKGSIIVIDPKEKFENKNFLLVVKDGALDPSIKQIIIYDDKKMLVPLSPLFEPDELSRNFIILGVIIQIKYNLKDI